MHIECMVMHDVQNESLVLFYQLGLLSPLPSGENEVSQTPHWFYSYMGYFSNRHFKCTVDKNLKGLLEILKQGLITLIEF